MGYREDDGGGVARGGISGKSMEGSFVTDDSMSSLSGSEVGDKRFYSEVSGSGSETGGEVFRRPDPTGRRGRGRTLARSRIFIAYSIASNTRGGGVGVGGWLRILFGEESWEGEGRREGKEKEVPGVGDYGGGGHYV